MKDERLFMRFPNTLGDDLGDLSYEAIGAFVVMVGEARKADNDGVFPRRRFEERWPARIIKAVMEHGPQPVLVLDGDVYRMPRYAQFQQTRADRELLSSKRAAAGSKGGSKRQALAKANAQANGKPVQAESESESEDLTTHLIESSPVVTARETTDSIELSLMAVHLAGQQGVTSLHAVIDAVWKHTRRRVDGSGALRLSLHLLGKAKTHPRVPQRYVTGAISRSPGEVQQWLDENAIGEAA